MAKRAKRKVKSDTLWIAKFKDSGHLCPPSCNRERADVAEWVRRSTQPGFSTFSIVRVGELKPRRRK